MTPVPARPGTAGAADAVRVGLVVLGRVEVDHVRDVVEVEAAGGDVRGDSVVTEPSSKRASARSRGDWLMSPCIAAARHAVARELLARRSAPRFVRTKTSTRPRSASRSSTSVSTLVSARDGDEVMVDLGRATGRTAARASMRAGDVVYSVRQLADLAVERGREEHRLPLA